MKLADVKNIVVSPLFGEPGHTHISTDGDASINDAPSGDEIAPRDLLPGTDEDEWAWLRLGDAAPPPASTAAWPSRCCGSPTRPNLATAPA